MSTQEILRNIGLNDKEIKVYLALLKTGKIRPAALSRITKINRATVYNIARGLIAKGIIAEDLGGSTLFLTPLPLESLSQLIEKPKRELEEKEALVKKAIAGLSLITADKKYSVPKIRFVEEDNLEHFLFENGVKWVKELQKGDGIWWSFQDHSFVEHYEKFVEWIGRTKEYRDPRVKSHLLTNQAPIEQKMEKKIPRSKRVLRFVEGLNFTSSIWISGDYIVMVVTNQHPFYLVEIHDAMLAHNMREVFKKLWMLTEKK
ncbi:MAG: helix-turn-helix domain-containing protein [Patescibacteria group bacterium]